MTARRFADYDFEIVEHIRPVTERNGTIREFTHQLQPDTRPNRYASGPFCRFRLGHAPTCAGVYAITEGDELKYIGECEDLSARFGPNGYGNIVARNCHHDGQATNCKINHLILKAAKAGQPITLWFHRSSDRKTVEAELIQQLEPPWNGRKERIIGRTTGAHSIDLDGMPTDGAYSTNCTVEDFRNALEEEFTFGTARGQRSVQVRSGDLHRKVGGYPGKGHKMRMCCRVMRSMMAEADRVINSPPKGAGAVLTIEYRLLRP